MAPSMSSLSNQSPMQAAYDLARNQSNEAQKDVFTKVRTLQSSSLQDDSIFARSSSIFGRSSSNVSISHRAKELASQNTAKL